MEESSPVSLGIAGIKRFLFSDQSDSSTSDDSKESDRSEVTTENRVNKNERSPAIMHDESDESSPLHSLEEGIHGATVQRYISKYLDTNLDSQLLPRSGRKQKEKESLSRTIKAAASQLSSDNAGKRHLLRRELSLSTGNLPSLLPPSSPASTPTTPTSPKPPASPSPLTTTGSFPSMADAYGNQSESGKKSEFSDVQGRSELRRRKRTSHISRHLERDMKKGNIHSDFVCHITPETVNRAVEKFSCVSCPKYSSQHGHKSPSFSAYPECPHERIQFYRTFSVLVRMGSKEKQLQDKQYTRMDSVENQLYQKDLKDLLWLDLMSWHGGSSMVEQDKLLYEQRRAVPLVLHEIMHFCIEDKTAKCRRSSGCNLTAVTGCAKSRYSAAAQTNLNAQSALNANEQNKKTAFRKISSEVKTIQSIVESLQKNSSSDSNSSTVESEQKETVTSMEEESCDCSETFSRVCQDCTNKETAVLEQVTTILEKLDQIEHLYPCTNSLGTDYSTYNSIEFVTRVKTLNLWYNITLSVQQKINLLAKLFGFKNRSEIGWPNYKGGQALIEPAKPEEHSVPDFIKPRSQPSVKILHFKVNSGVDSSPTTSGSDGTEAKSSVPASPDVHSVSPFDTSSSTNSSGYHSSQQMLRLCSVLSATNSGTHIYRKYVDKALKQKGLRHIYIQLSGILKPVLIWIHATLKRRCTTYAEATAKPVDGKSGEAAKEGYEGCSKENYEELFNHGMWSETFRNIGLPTFHRPFFFLMRVPLDVVHECLRLRIEQQPEEPSALSIRQLIKECKEVLRAAVQMRQQYVTLAQTVLGEGGSDVIEAQLDLFDEDLKTMLLVYLRYLEQLMLIMQKVSPVSLQQKSYLEEEWIFVRANCPHIPGGEALAVHKFCFMASDLLGSIGHCLETGIDECIAILYESSASEHDGSPSYRKGIQDACRQFKNIFNVSSERARQAIAFAKTLRKDLEIATEFKILVSTEALLQKLRETEHILVIAPHSSSHLMFVPGHLQHNVTYIWQLVDMTCGHESSDIAHDHDGYLIMMSCDTCSIEGTSWDGPALVLEPTAEATITLSHVEVDGLLLVVNHSSQLMSQCRKFQRVMGSTLEVDKQQTSCNHAIAEALNELKSEALELREKITKSIRQVEEKFDAGALPDLDEIERVSLQKRCREILHQGYQFGFEYQKAVTRLITGEARARMGKGLISFALQWMKFVSERCEQGRGRRPRWANQGLEFLITACDPQNLQNLSEDEFQVLKQSMNDCISHLIGSPDKSSTSRMTSPTQMNLSPGRFSFSGRSYSTASSRTDASSTPSTPPPLTAEEYASRRRSEEDPFNFERISSSLTPDVTPIENVRRSIQELEEVQQKRLEEASVIGHIVDIVVPQAYLHISARRVTFPWQRGFKIGEGRFGKVYTAVNNTTGELIAMKEIRLQQNDHRAIKEAMDEIRIFEGIKHPNIVRYYGVEIHREEMLIFMEYCNEGSLESASQLCLPESLVRKYTRQLLEAVNVLHEHGIVHRDIKSANIFLMSDGSLKLGDFGCCTKLKNQTTMAGELHGFVGTPAYMAPEVFTKTIAEGHGRAADVWSVGCVVLEMASGQRPWHDLENSFQIMFRVGMGEIPKVPINLSIEGQDFLGHCLQYDPSQRWTSSQLLDHPFTKVHEEED